MEVLLPVSRWRIVLLQRGIKDGQFLVHCFKGCPQDDVVDAMKERRLWPEPEHKGWNGIGTQHDYVDEEDVLLFQIVRPDSITNPGFPKAFARHVEHGQWVNGAKRGGEKIRRVLYRLPAVLKAETVFLTEGEKDADALEKLGLTATTNPFGATAGWLAVYTEALRGKKAILLPDNDKVGQEHMHTVAYQIHREVASCKVIELPNQPAKGDVRDWLKAGGDRQKLEALVAAAPEYVPRWQDQPKNKVALQAEPDDDGPSRLVTRQLSVVEEEPVEWLWENRLPRGMITMIAADPAVGKSTIAADWAARLTAPYSPQDRYRRDYWPDYTRRTGGPYNVIVVSAEDGTAHTIRPRHRAAGADLERVYVVESVTPAASDKTTLKERLFSLESDIRELEKKIEEIGNVAMVVIDPVTAYMGRADTHRNSEVRALLGPLAKLAEKYNIAVVIVTHLNKNEAKDWKSINGTIGFYALARVVYMVVEDPTDEDSTPPRKLLFHEKGTLHLGEKPQPLAYRITEVEFESKKGLITTTRLDWDDMDDHPAHMTLEEVVALQKQRGGSPTPKQQLVIDLLENGPDLKAYEIFSKLDWEHPNPRVFLGRMVTRKLIRKRGLRYGKI
jgi:hypothetical protein